MPGVAAPTESSSAQIAAEIRRRIRSGELVPGDRVPSTRQLTRDFGVAMATASKVLAALRQEGLVRALPGIGTIVAVDPAPPTETSSTRMNLDGPDAAATDREPGLSRERVVLAAIRIADAEGFAALSMRRVAADLGTATMSLYRHVQNKDELLMAMADNVFARYPLPPAEPDWRIGLESLCRLQWRGYQHHPWLAQYVSMTRPQLVPRAMKHTERAMALLAELGLDVGDRLHMAVTLANYVRGLAVNLEPEAQAVQDTGMTNDEWMDTQVPLMTQIVSSGEYPMFVEMATADDVNLSLDSLFEFGLARLLDGLDVFGGSASS
jgi:DNA-binding transcriptional regulator YhcF (GntR family)